MKAWNKLSHMKNKCLIPLMTLTLLFGSVTPAYAQSNENKEEETTTDIVREIESTEVKEDPKPEPNPLTPDGNANILDEADSSQNKLFYTITTANGNNFYLIIDKDRNSQNVYMLSAIDEVDLKDFIEEASEIPDGTITGDDGLLTDDQLSQQKQDETKEDETEPGSETKEDPIPEKKANPFLSLLIVGILALAGAGAFFFIKKKRSSDYSDDEDETIYGNPESEEVNEDSDDDIEIMEVEYPDPDDYPDESGLPKDGSDSDQ